MFIYQDGKIYIQDDKGLVGVNIYSDKVLMIDTEKAKLKPTGVPYELWVLKLKFNITDDIAYIFPVTKKKAGGDNDTVGTVKANTRKSSRK